MQSLLWCKELCQQYKYGQIIKTHNNLGIEIALMYKILLDIQVAVVERYENMLLKSLLTDRTIYKRLFNIMWSFKVEVSWVLYFQWPAILFISYNSQLSISLTRSLACILAYQTSSIPVHVHERLPRLAPVVRQVRAVDRLSLDVPLAVLLVYTLDLT